MIISDQDLEKIVAFAILMENDKGILNKSPGYIKEKYLRKCSQVGADTAPVRVGIEEIPEAGLDSSNQKKFQEWKDKWLKKVEDN